MKTKYWIMKSEPSEYSIDNLKKDGKSVWTGIRNYQVRNMLRDEIKISDMAFFYHSNAKEIGIVGEIEVVSNAYPDPTQFDKRDKHYDPGSTKDDPRWLCVDVLFVKKFKRIITLAELKVDPVFSDLALVKKGNRLSITEIEKKHFEQINRMANF